MIDDRFTSANGEIVSVDRIDSEQHYSPDNLQLTFWFANGWKEATPNDELYQRHKILTDECPLSAADGGYGLGVSQELVASLASRIDDVLIGIEDRVGEPVLSAVLPDVLNRVELWRSRGQQYDGDVLW